MCVHVSMCVSECVCVLVTQSCPTLWDPIDYSLPGSSVHGISQARILEWVAISFSRLLLLLLLSHFSRVRLFAIPWTVAHQAPLSMEFPRQEYWSRLPFPSHGDLPNPGIKPVSLYDSCIGRQVIYH